MADHTEVMLEAMRSAPDLNIVKALLNAELQRRGFERFAYVQLRAPRGSRQRVYIGTYPQNWSDHYRNDDLQIHDPLYFHAAGTISPFLWSEVRQLREEAIAEKRIFAPAADIGLRSGGGVPIHGPHDGVATLHVADESDPASFEPRFRARRFELQMIAFAAHEAIVRLTADGMPLDLQFTPLQKELLLWTARGKSNTDIADIVGLKPDRVRQHLIAINKILNVGDRTQAAVIAVSRFIVDL